MNLLAADLGESLFNDPNHFLTQPSGVSTLQTLFLSNSLVIGGIFLVILIILAGYGMISASGDKSALANSSKLITYGLGGFLLIFVTYFILRVIDSMTGGSTGLF